jgi:ribosomal protein S18 acetylase RimI-like enzyme
LTGRSIRLRPIRDADRPFLERVYASTRVEELAPVPWTAEEKAAFLRQQFAAQHAHYTTHYAEASFDMVVVDDAPAGRLYVARWAEELRIIDIAILPELRGAGIGTRLLRELLDEADDRGVPVTIHVERQNRAQRLYRRLGFEPVQDAGVYVLMRRAVQAAQPNAAS